MADTLTLDQAADIALAEDDNSQAIVPYDQPLPPEPDDFDEGELDGGNDTGDGLTLDQAAEIEWTDDADVQRIATNERPVAIIEGHPVTLTELVRGFVDGARLQAHASNVAKQYMDVQDAAEKVAGSAWALAGLISRQLPPSPDESLLYLNPMEFTRRKAVFDEAVAVVETALAQGDEARQAAGVLAGQRHGATLQGEFYRLVEHFPNCATPEGREALVETVRDAVYSCDFTESDILNVVDHRLFRLAHLAAIGKRVQDRQEAPRPKKRRRHRHRHSEAMQRLAQTGSIEAAMAVDFD